MVNQQGLRGGTQYCPWVFSARPQTAEQVAGTHPAIRPTATLFHPAKEFSMFSLLNGWDT